MDKPKVYVDGQAGTTGLEIVGRLKNRDDLELLMLDDDLRHDDAARKAIMEKSDVTILCLPDQAAREAVELADGCCRIIDTSTAHRTVWPYGFRELDDNHKAAIITADKVANPGCHATGFISLAAPLSQAGLLKKERTLKCFSLTGYSGGGKKMIAEYEGDELPEGYSAPRLYGLSLNHKHLPEMIKECDLEMAPVFLPVVDDYKRGMALSLMIDQDDLVRPVSREDLLKIFHEKYDDSALIHVMDDNPGPMLSAERLAGYDDLEIYINSNGSQFVLTALFDNLGKGASGAAIQNLNLMLGLDECAGLHLLHCN